MMPDVSGCPHCGADLQRSTHRNQRRTDSGVGRKSLGHELVSCPECGGVVDGFSAH